MTVWAYYRVSTDKQDYESQRVGVVDYAKRAGLLINREIVDDGVSGVVEAKKRKLNTILRQMQPGDTIITSELSRLGRSTADVIRTCNIIASHQVNCYLVKQGIHIDQTPMGKMMIAILSAFAEMERDLIAQRTKESLRLRKQRGLKLGRPFGCKNKKHWCDGKIDEIKRLWQTGLSARQIAAKFKVCSTTINALAIQNPDIFPFREKVIALNSKDGKANKPGQYWIKKQKENVKNKGKTNE